MDGAEMRKLREAHGLSQRALAGLLGVAPNSVARWERGERPIARVVELAVRFACGSYVPGRGVVPAAAAQSEQSAMPSARHRGRGFARSYTRGS